MKIKIILLLILSNCILLSCGRKLHKNDLEKGNLNANIVSVKTTKYNVTEKFGEPVKGEKNCSDFLDICENVTKYNSLGNQIEFTDYNSYGISFITKLKYNDKNQKIEQNRYTPVEGKRVMQFLSKYDSKGNCIEIVSDSGYNEKKEYDENNNCTKKIIKYWKTGEDNIITYFYNKNNEIIIQEYSERKTEFKYDNNGNVKDIISYNKDGSLKKKESYTYRYDEHQNWTIEIEYENKVPINYRERIIEYKK